MTFGRGLALRTVLSSSQLYFSSIRYARLKSAPVNFLYRVITAMKIINVLRLHKQAYFVSGSSSCSGPAFPHIGLHYGDGP